MCCVCTTEQEEEEPEWVEVMVDILLSLLSQPSRLIRQVCKTVFSSICPHVTATALNAIIDVSSTLGITHFQIVTVSYLQDKTLDYICGRYWLRLFVFVVMEMV